MTEPWYLLLDAVGAVPENESLDEPFPEAMFELPRRAVWQLRLWSALLPALALVLLAGRVASGSGPGRGCRSRPCSGSGR